MSKEEKKMIQRFMKITNTKDENLSIAYLNKFLYNLDNAIEAYFSNNYINPIEKKNLEAEPVIEIQNEKPLSIFPNFTKMFSFDSCNNCLFENENKIDKIFKDIPSLINKNDFEKKLKQKLVLYILYDKNSISKLKEIIDIIKNNPYINFKIENFCSLIKEEYKNSLLKISLSEDVICPIIVFCHNKNKNDGFNKRSIIAVFDGKKESFDFPIFFMKILNQNKSTINQFDKPSFSIQEVFITDNGLNNNKNGINEKIKVTFFFPSDKNFEKEFFINDTIEDLYAYLLNLGDELYNELDSKNFYIAIPEPFTPIKEDFYNKTLKELNFKNEQTLNIIDNSD